MKLTSIEIEGMHKVDHLIYDFENVNYITGPNGAGKSTVLQAIQLALLGYIPGYPKTKEGILKHANGDVLRVEATLDDNGSERKISRRYTRKGAVEISPGADELSARLLADEGLPIFNFAEFKGMTANKLKEWFINYLPSGSSTINWEDTLIDALGERINILDNELLDDVLADIPEESDSVDDVKALNANIKASQSFYKGQLTSLQGTAQSLVHYDDCEITDPTEVIQEINDLNHKKSVIQSQLAAKQRYDTLMQSKSQLTKPDTDMTIPELDKAKLDLQSRIDADNAKLQNIMSEISVIRATLGKDNTAGLTSCPYTGKECKDLADIQSERQSQEAEAKSKIAELDAQAQSIHNAITANKSLQINIDFMHRSLLTYESQLAMIDKELEGLSPIEPSENILDVDAEIFKKQELYSKILANQKYAELQGKVDSDKSAIENKIEVLKVWDKLTGANGLQTEMMNKPFEDLAAKITDYINLVFRGQSLTAAFNLEAKANSFSFGIVKGSEYIDYDYLSSGEKCLYTLALMMCILDESQSDLKLIMIDDMLDHLDDDNAESLFKMLSDKTDIQFILAGVKSCSIDTICMEV